MLGACLELEERRGAILKLIKQRIGLDVYGDVWEGIKTSKLFTMAASGNTRWSSRKSESLLNGKGAIGGVILYTPEMGALLSAAYAQAHAAVLDAHTLPSPTRAAAPPSTPLMQRP